MAKLDFDFVPDITFQAQKKPSEILKVLILFFD